MMEPPYFTRVCKTSEQLARALQTLSDRSFNPSELPIEIIVHRHKKRRTDQQNRYLWGVVLAIIAQETGNDVNDLYEYFLGEFFGWQEHEVMGRKRLRPRERSSKQIKARFSEFLEFIISKAAGLGIIIPPPNHDLPASFSESK